MSVGTIRKSRASHAEAILGPHLHSQLPNAKVLLVGAGGIGCELLKNIVLTGFGHITLLDLDTIDLSNLNRQFLFKKKDVKQSKALVAAQTAAPFNPNVRITPIHANIKEPQFDVDWLQRFDIVLNALDNLDARRHVNKMCMAANVPLVESGTAGYLGQVQPILKDKTECFDCVPKETPKTFPVCTIRSTPSQPIHCIVWAKSYLLSQLFGEDEDAIGELDRAEEQGENKTEIATLRKEAEAFKIVRDALQSVDKSHNAARLVFEKVYNKDVRNLLSMADMWRSRAPPVPLEFDAIKGGTFALRPSASKGDAPAKSQSHAFNGNAVRPNGQVSAASAVDSAKHNGTQKLTNGTKAGDVSSSAAKAAGLKDQRKLTLQDNLSLFIASTTRLASRLQAGEQTIAFDKDDDDTLDFVTAAANLRSAAYGIEQKTRWEIKEMAGNIIPAIATTNAIISGLIVLQALQLLRKSYDKMRNIHLQVRGQVPLGTSTLCPPNPECGVCRDTYVRLRCDPERVTLCEVVDSILGDGETGGIGKRDVSIFEDKRLLSDPEFDDNNNKTLASLSVTRGKFLTIVDEEGEFGNIAVAITILPPNHPADGPAYILPSPLPTPPKAQPHTVAAPEPQPTTSRKRPADDDDIIIEPSPKRAKPNSGLAARADVSSPSKKRRLDEDGFILMDEAGDKLEDDVIEID